MKKRVLLINYTEQEAQKMGQLPFTIDRGCITEPVQVPTGVNTITITRLFYAPHPIYEYDFAFIKLESNKDIIKEFEKRLERFESKETKEIHQFWTRFGFLVVLLGEYPEEDLSFLGLPKVNLASVTKQDITLNALRTDSGSFSQFANDIKSLIKTPPSKYVEASAILYGRDADYKYHSLYWNASGKDFGAIIDTYRNYSNSIRPRVVIFPMFSDVAHVSNNCVKQISKLFPDVFQGVFPGDWIESDYYYPSSVQELDKTVDELIESTKIKIQDLKTKKENEKEKYKLLRNILHKTGDELKQSVIYVLENIFNLKVLDSDAQKKSPVPDEDIVIEIGDRIIMAEIKGDKSQNPTPRHISQLWKHLSRNKAIKDGALILNYDWTTNPDERSLAYTGEYEKDVEEIIFIDTREMFNLAIAIIDHAMDVSIAVETLFRSGRVRFDLQDFIENKKVTPN